MKIAVAGKGGVGKTLVAGTLARFLGKEGIQVLAVDADPNPTLASALGVSPDVAEQIIPLTENDELVEERTGMDRKTYGGMFKLNPHVSDLAEKFGVPAPDNVTLLAEIPAEYVVFPAPGFEVLFVLGGLIITATIILKHRQKKRTPKSIERSG